MWGAVDDRSVEAHKHVLVFLSSRSLFLFAPRALWEASGGPGGPFGDSAEGFFPGHKLSKSTLKKVHVDLFPVAFFPCVWVPVACCESGMCAKCATCALQTATPQFLWGSLLSHPNPSFAQKTLEQEAEKRADYFCFDHGDFFAGRTV